MFARAIILARAGANEAHAGDSELLEAAASFAPVTVALCLGPEEAARHFTGKCDICLCGPSLANRPDALALAETLRPQMTENTLVLARHDSLGMDVGPGLATLLDLPLVTNIRSLEGVAGQALANQVLASQVLVRRPEFGGQVVAEYAVKTEKGAVFTTMPGAFAGERVVKKTVTLPVTAPANGRRVFLEEMPPPEIGVNLRASPVLVAVGRGMGAKENVAFAFELASLLGGEVCCSRAVADAGWLEKDRQVGISGETVSPAIYIALGLHGAFQHMAGVTGSPCVIAVNTNKDAPIFQSAEFGALTDAASFAALLAKALRPG